MSETRATLESYTVHRTVILKELASTVNQAEVAVVQRMVLSATRGFVAGTGRSGLARKLAAVGIMPLSLTTHAAGEVAFHRRRAHPGTETSISGRLRTLIVAPVAATTAV